MENQKLSPLVIDLPENEQNTIPSVTDDGILSESVTNNYENSADELILVPEKVIDTKKQPPIVNTFEVLEDQESKDVHIKYDNEVIDLSKDEENEYVFDSPVVSAKTEDLTPLQKTESLKEPVDFGKLEAKNIDTIKTATSQKNEPINMVQHEAKTVDIPEIISVVSKKDTEEGDVCDIKIGPEELFCRIGLGKITF